MSNPHSSARFSVSVLRYSVRRGVRFCDLEFWCVIESKKGRFSLISGLVVTSAAFGNNFCSFHHSTRSNIDKEDI